MLYRFATIRECDRRPDTQIGRGIELTYMARQKSTRQENLLI